MSEKRDPLWAALAKAGLLEMTVGEAMRLRPILVLMLLSPRRGAA